MIAFLQGMLGAMAPVIQDVSIEHRGLPHAVQGVQGRHHGPVQQHPPLHTRHQLTRCIKAVSLACEAQVQRQCLGIRRTVGHVQRAGSEQDPACRATISITAAMGIGTRL